VSELQPFGAEGLWRKAHATQQVLTTRIGAQWVPGSVHQEIKFAKGTVLIGLLEPSKNSRLVAEANIDP
jgi:hypothetical protein